jgi:hypothetical protein
MLLAFAHIEKTGGTTLNQVLRRNYFLKFIDVRPLEKSSGRVFRSGDLRKYLVLNPCLRAISGHAIRPAIAESTGLDGIRYVTLLRDPLRRYVSQFLYFVRIGVMEDDFGKFLDHEEFTDFQTRKLSETGDVKAAMATLEKMFAVGASEEFDAFLLRLGKSLAPDPFDPRYVLKNAGSEDSDRAALLLERYRGRIEARNTLDQALYEFATTRIIPRSNREYGGSLDADLARFAERNAGFRLSLRDYADFAVRKLYYEPASSIIRKFSGLAATGSY